MLVSLYDLVDVLPISFELYCLMISWNVRSFGCKSYVRCKFCKYFLTDFGLCFSIMAFSREEVLHFDKIQFTFTFIMCAL